jgi:hypothetical protein
MLRSESPQFVRKSPSEKGPTASKPRSARARLTNASARLPGTDGRSAGARRFRDLVETLAAERGGIAALTEGEVALVRQAAGLAVRAETLQGELVRGETVNGTELVRLSNALARTLTALGRPKAPQAQAGQTLGAYLAQKAGAAS